MWSLQNRLEELNGLLNNPSVLGGISVDPTTSTNAVTWANILWKIQPAFEAVRFKNIVSSYCH